jgi:hypothetical protein
LVSQSESRGLGGLGDSMGVLKDSPALE